MNGWTAVRKNKQSMTAIQAATGFLLGLAACLVVQPAREPIRDRWKSRGSSNRAENSRTRGSARSGR